MPKVGDLCVPVSYEPSQETPPLLLEAVNDDVLRPHLVQRLRVRGVTEGVPEVKVFFGSKRPIVITS